MEANVKLNERLVVVKLFVKLVETAGDGKSDARR